MAQGGNGYMHTLRTYGFHVTLFDMVALNRNAAIHGENLVVHSIKIQQANNRTKKVKLSFFVNKFSTRS